jgi:flagellar hook-length control protein FliK
MQNSLPEVTDQLVAEVEGAQDSTKPTVLRYIPNPIVTIQAATNHPSQISASAIGDALVNTNRPAVDAAETPASRPALQHIELAVRETGWDKLVAERVLVMANSRLQNAEIRLTPAELGPLRVQLAVEDGAAHVTFQTQHALTREAIEQALPRLREMLAENGLSLGQANVDSEGDTGVRQHDQGNAGTERQSQESAATDSADSADTDIDQGPDTTIKAAAGNSLVDTFA